MNISVVLNVVLGMRVTSGNLVNVYGVIGAKEFIAWDLIIRCWESQDASVIHVHCCDGYPQNP